MYEEELCIYFENSECKLENERNDYQPCCTCSDKYILEEGQEVEITEVYTLTRKNGKVVKFIDEETFEPFNK